MHPPIPSSITRAAIGRDRPRPVTLTASAVLVPLALFVLALALRLNQIDAFGVWFDDTHSIHMARLSL